MSANNIIFMLIIFLVSLSSYANNAKIIDVTREPFTYLLSAETIIVSNAETTIVTNPDGTVTFNNIVISIPGKEGMFYFGSENHDHVGNSFCSNVGLDIYKSNKHKNGIFKYERDQRKLKLGIAIFNDSGHLIDIIDRKDIGDHEVERLLTVVCKPHNKIEEYSNLTDIVNDALVTDSSLNKKGEAALTSTTLLAASNPVTYRSEHLNPPTNQKGTR